MRATSAVELIGVCFDGSGRAGGQARAPSALRAAGLSAALPDAAMSADIDGPPPDVTRGPHGFANEAALLAMVSQVEERVRRSLERQRFPVVYGADCAVLLGAVPALRDHCGRAGLLILDAHEDATTLERSPDGEAANMEIALLLGLTGRHLPRPIDGLPALDPDSLVMIGQRDRTFRESTGTPSVGDRVRLHREQAVHGHEERLATGAVEHLDRATPAWWVHVDLDVLHGDDFPACAAADDPATPGGLRWAQLTTIVRRALTGRGPRGLSVGVSNTDLDPDGHSARRIVTFLADVLDADP